MAGSLVDLCGPQSFVILAYNVLLLVGETDRMVPKRPEVTLRFK